jgi:phosphoenolpyruvate-protein kinase (PTS system EI component)
MKMNSEPTNNEVHLSGAPGSPGIVIGTTSLYKRVRPAVSDANIPDRKVQTHLDRFDYALEAAEKELHELLEATDEQETGELIQTQIAILKDPDLHKRVKRVISDHKKPVDSAVETTFKGYLEVLKKNHGASYENKSVDITDICERLLQILHDKKD